MELKPSVTVLLVLLLATGQWMQALQQDITEDPPTRTIQLLLMLHFPEREQNHTEGEGEKESKQLPLDIWDKGDEILPAAQMAVKQINANTTLLSGYTLQLNVTSIDPCRVDQFASNHRALVPFIEIASRESHPALGIVGGPFCPPLLDRLISPLASQSHTRLFELSGSVAATARDHNLDLNFITPSVKLYYETVYAMMRQFNWTSVFVIAESFFKGATQVLGSSGLNITYRQFFPGSPSLFDELRHSETRIIFASVDAYSAAEVLCRAQSETLIYPSYVWVFHDLSPSLILQSREDMCSEKDLEKALNGSFFLQFPFAPKSANTTLISGQLYSEYLSEYKSLLSEGLQPNPFANVVYDSMWAFALTLNQSISSRMELHSNADALEAKQMIIELMDQMLPRISFEGASGTIDFSKQYINDVVKIFLNLNGSTDEVGVYQASENISVDQSIFPYLPSDVLPSVYLLIPFPLTIFLAFIIGMCFVLTSVVVLLFVRFRQDPDIKAASPHLSSLMFLGCYLLFAAALLHVIAGAVVIKGVGVDVICGAVMAGGSLGVNLIFTTLLLRMLRVYRIFSSFGKTSKLWSNKYMVCIVGVVVLCDVALIMVWALVDTFRLVDRIALRPYANPPHYQIHQDCHSDHLTLWLGLLLGKLSILFTIVFFLAIKTRKIRRSNFKDTKKVNIYIFLTIMVVIVTMALYFLFKSTNNVIATHLMLYLAFGITGFLCQVFLFVPKVVSPILRRCGYEVAYEKSKGRKVLAKKPEIQHSRTALVAQTSHFTALL